MNRSKHRTPRWLRAAVVAVTAIGLTAGGILPASAASSYTTDPVSVDVSGGEVDVQVRVQTHRDAAIVFLYPPEGMTAVEAGGAHYQKSYHGYRFWTDSGNLKGSTVWMTVRVPKNFKPGTHWGSLEYYLNGVSVEKGSYSLYVQDPTPDAFGSAQVGQTTDSIVVSHPSRTEYGTMTITAPPGTTFESVSKPGDQAKVKISSDKKTATIARAYIGHINPVSVKIAVPSGVKPGQTLVGRSDTKAPDPNNMILTKGSYFVHVTETIPSQTATAPPGETTSNIRLDLPYRIVGTAILTAPPGTTFHSVTSGGSSAVLSDDRTKANTGGSDFGGGAPPLVASLNIPADAKPGTRFPGGTVEIKDTSDPRGFVLAAGSFDAEVSQRGASLISPLPGSTITPVTEFIGTGPVGDVVTVMDKSDKSLGTATVDEYGNWGLTLASVPSNGPMMLRFVSAHSDGAVFAEGNYTMTGSVDAFKVLSPVLAPNESVTNGTVFTGVGHPGSAVTITDKDGTVAGGTVVDADGNWSTSITGLAEGPNRLTATAELGGHDPQIIDLGPVVIVEDDPEEPVMDPALAGGVALALLAVAGTVIAVRRRIGQQ